MNNDFKKGFSFSAGVLVALLIPTSIFFISSNLWSKYSKNQAAKKEYSRKMAKCIRNNPKMELGKAKRYCKTMIINNITQVPF